MLSVVIPAFNEEEMISVSKAKISSILDVNGIDFEIIYIDDGSDDNTWNEIKRECLIDQKVRGVHFSKNFGKESAIMAGLNEAKGDCTVVIDCDLQHPPETMVEMYRLWEEGYEVVEGVKTHRGKEKLIYKIFAKWFYTLIGVVSGVDMENASDFKLLDRKVVDTLKCFTEKSIFFRAISSWTGFKKTSVGFEVADRTVGKSKWSAFSLIKYAVRNIASFSTAPMQLVTIMGIFTFLVSIVIGCISLFQYFTGSALEGFTTIIILQLLFSSIIMISIGVVGYYVARIFEEVKNRPIYVISEKCGDDNGAAD